MPTRAAGWLAARTAKASRRWPARPTGTTWATTSPSRTAGTTFWGHRGLVINLGRRDDQPTLLAVAGDNHLPILTALKHRFTAIEPQVAFGAFRAMAPCGSIAVKR